MISLYFNLYYKKLKGIQLLDLTVMKRKVELNYTIKPSHTRKMTKTQGMKSIKSGGQEIAMLIF